MMGVDTAVGTAVCNSHWLISLKRESGIREEALGVGVLPCEDRRLSTHVPQRHSFHLPQALLLEVPGLFLYTRLSFTNCLLRAQGQG